MLCDNLNDESSQELALLIDRPVHRSFKPQTVDYFHMLFHPTKVEKQENFSSFIKA